PRKSTGRAPPPEHLQRRRGGIERRGRLGAAYGKHEPERLARWRRKTMSTSTSRSVHIAKPLRSQSPVASREKSFNTTRSLLSSSSPKTAPTLLVANRRPPGGAVVCQNVVTSFSGTI